MASIFIAPQSGVTKGFADLQRSLTRGDGCSAESRETYPTRDGSLLPLQAPVPAGMGGPRTLQARVPSGIGGLQTLPGRVPCGMSALQSIQRPVPRETGSRADSAEGVSPMSFSFVKR